MEPSKATAGKEGETAPGLPPRARDVWVTGVGLISSLGSGAAAHWDAVSSGAGSPRVDTTTYAPYPVHRLADIRFEDQVPNKADLRQMGRWQQIGVFAAGLALDDAGLKGNAEALADTDLVVAAGNGERDATADAAILQALKGTAPLIGALQSSLRPTLYLAELSNLLAGNISIVHGVTRSSRTFKGEEQAGVAAVRDAARRIADGTSKIALVGGACNGERSDLHLSLELCGTLWHGEVLPVRQRAVTGGGIILGSIGSFIVLEDAQHARDRGARPYARVRNVVSSRMKFAEAGDSTSTDDFSMQRCLREAPGALVDVLSGASGVSSAMAREMAFIEALQREDLVRNVHCYGDAVGHGIEAHFPTGIALASIALARRRMFPAFDNDPVQPASSPAGRILVTGFGQWRGGGAALLEAVEEPR